MFNIVDLRLSTNKHGLYLLVTIISYIKNKAKHLYWDTQGRSMGFFLAPALVSHLSIDS